MPNINMDKCCQISFSRCKNSLKTNYTINKIPLNIVTSIKDLGVILSNNLLFNNHLDMIHNKAKKMLGFLK
jgi:hypothetical protein